MSPIGFHFPCSPNHPPYGYLSHPPSVHVAEQSKGSVPVNFCQIYLTTCPCPMSLSKLLKGSFKRCSLQMAANTSSTLDHKLVTGIYRLNHPHAAAGSWNVGLEDLLVIVSINSSTKTIIAIIENGFSSRRCREAAGVATHIGCESRACYSTAGRGLESGTSVNFSWYTDPGALML